MFEKGVFVWLVVLLCLPVAFAVQLADCYIASSCSGNFSAFGRVSGEGHFTTDVSVNLPFYLCCLNEESKGGGAVSFRFADENNGAGHVSVNSTKTVYPGVARFGYPDACFLKQGCNITNSEICVFRVSNSSLESVKWRSVADSSLVADCNIANVPDPNSYPNEVCCKLREICNDGIDNDGDGYIDCADEDCKHYTGGEPPEFCTGSPFTSDVCIQLIRNEDGTTNITRNPLCMGQIPGDPVLNPGNLSYHCDYGKVPNPNSPGVCCAEGKYAYQDPYTHVWSCQESDPCGLAPLKCLYDFDLNTTQWFNSRYIPGNEKWCQSRMPYLYTPDVIPFAPHRSTGCCYMVMYGDVGYYTDEGNVKIFGYQKVCGDFVVDPPNEQCDGVVYTPCNSTNFRTCPIGYGISGNLSCTSACHITNSTCSCVFNSGNGGVQ